MTTQIIETMSDTPCTEIMKYFLVPCGPVALWPDRGHGFFIPEVYRSHKTTHHSR